MKRMLATLMVAMMIMAMTTPAFADEIVHGGDLPASSSQDVKITINAVKDSSEGGSENALPSEYHVIVNWDVQDGVYDATKSDSSDDDGFKNFSWDCVKLQYDVVEPEVGDGEDDPRSANWVTKPKVAFEVINASTPDLSIKSTISIDGEDAWKNFIKSNPVTSQFTTPVTIAPVSKANMGTGVASASQGKVGIGVDAENDEDYEYVLNWDYSALDAYALKLYQEGSGSESFNNTFVVTIDAA